MGDTERTEPKRRPGARRRARELALAALYRADLLGLGESAALASLPETLSLNQESWPERGRVAQRLRAEALEYAHQLLTGVWLDREALDAAIEESATGWSLDRMPITDRNILRIALSELRRGEPVAVVVNEAVELASQYGGPESSRFVNGVLGGYAARRAAEGEGGEA
jgi:N utilization substance protein B